ncbi:hypothetical protein BKA83DRAFT_4131348 [Pisolithus microcarpus]|nr:hypothetical protein BKA83DRAFT_4131348 [Pisolithus microcarpus]
MCPEKADGDAEIENPPSPAVWTFAFSMLKNSKLLTKSLVYENLNPYLTGLFGMSEPEEIITYQNQYNTYFKTVISTTKALVNTILPTISEDDMTRPVLTNLMCNSTGQDINFGPVLAESQTGCFQCADIQYSHLNIKDLRKQQASVNQAYYSELAGTALTLAREKASNIVFNTALDGCMSGQRKSYFKEVYKILPYTPLPWEGQPPSTNKINLQNLQLMDLEEAKEHWRGHTADELDPHEA